MVGHGGLSPAIQVPGSLVRRRPASCAGGKVRVRIARLNNRWELRRYSPKWMEARLIGPGTLEVQILACIIRPRTVEQNKSADIREARSVHRTLVGEAALGTTANRRPRVSPVAEWWSVYKPQRDDRSERCAQCSERRQLTVRAYAPSEPALPISFLRVVGMAQLVCPEPGQRAGSRRRQAFGSSHRGQPHLQQLPHFRSFQLPAHGIDNSKLRAKAKAAKSHPVGDVDFSRKGLG